MTILLTQSAPLLESQVNDYIMNNYEIAPVKLRLINLYDLHYNDGYDVSHLGAEPILTDYWSVNGENVTRIDDLTDVTQVSNWIASFSMINTCNWTDDLTVTKKWLAGIESKYNIIAVDFETKDLTIPQFNHLTMVTIGWNLTKSIVIVFDNQAVQDYVLNWLVTTELRQVYHNALFDVRLIHYFTKGKLPKHIEDSQLLASVYRNHVNPLKRKTGLKELAKFPYASWASDKSSFELYEDSTGHINPNMHYFGSSTDTHKYNLPLIYYASIDSQATKFVWDMFDTEVAYPSEWIFQTSEPRYNTEGFNQRYYYDFILKPAIPMIVEMLNTGQGIDLDQVTVLSDKVEAIKQSAMDVINSFQIVQDFQNIVDTARIEKFLEPVRKSMKQPNYTGYINNVAMRTFVVNYYAPFQSKKITATDLKKPEYRDLGVVMALAVKDYEHEAIITASNAYAEQHAYNMNVKANRIDKLENPQNYVDIGFNPYNYKQLAQMWTHFGLISEETSKKTGEMSFSSPILKEMVNTLSGDIQQIMRSYLEISQASNLMKMYIPKYRGSTVDGRVYGNIRLLGTITGRLSGKAPKMVGDAQHRVGINLVTQPASSSAFAKPIKRLFVAPPGKILVGIDYANLEGHVGAILTHDETSIRNLVEKFDTHVLHSAAYWTQAWEQLSGIKFNKASLAINKQYKALCDTVPEAKALRSNSKGVTFGLAYGAYPPKVASSIGCSIEEAQGIFDNFHNVLYPGVTAYREEYVQPTVEQNGYIHLNWGLKLFSSDARKDIRTLNNATMQSYSVLTQIAAVEFRNFMIKHNKQSRIQIVNVIHDAIYAEVDDDPILIKWVNDNLPRIMAKQFVDNQAMPIRAELDIGYNLYDIQTLNNDADLTEIEEKLSALLVKT